MRDTGLFSDTRWAPQLHQQQKQRANCLLQQETQAMASMGVLTSGTVHVKGTVALWSKRRRVNDF
eukprot:5658168-Amphidinium_carterae.2